MAVFSALCALALICLNQAGLAQEPVTVPSGTAIVVILTDPLDSSRAALGEISRASVHEPVVLGDVVAVRKGSDAQVPLVRSPDGKNWFVKLTGLNVKGKNYRVVASFAEVKASGGKAVRRAVGAVIGRIAGGDRGGFGCRSRSHFRGRQQVGHQQPDLSGGGEEVDDQAGSRGRLLRSYGGNGHIAGLFQNLRRSSHVGI